jgi:hypothetical protein
MKLLTFKSVNAKYCLDGSKQYETVSVISRDTTFFESL